ncbi:homoserine O-acetyltransferase [Roseisolibacter sp. H3M3-2]|uniref:homoserine O-acetyltransferase family protein n=1 Tax=Roseisolibacter sp. H3M3-2 TaxID=3031323 RepID=UPI0023D9A3B4|nr:homoserine O-acetyltransferase [Roseisolibacter sp. H3M3-2]MDF1503817.1 homoserine O-acetyltransferase [Roseisolibacter sp. H3M3-2]
MTTPAANTTPTLGAAERFAEEWADARRRAERAAPASAPPRVRAGQLHDRFALECGAVLLDVHQHFVLDGVVNAARDNVVLVLHALTGSADAACPERGWWRDLIGPGRAIDTRRHAVLAPNLLGSCYGTTGPSRPWTVAAGTWNRRGFPPVTTRDMARLVGRLVDALRLPSLAAVVGGSLGGMVAQEFLLEHPGRARSAVVLAAPDAHTAQAIAWNHAQREALRLGAAAGDPDAGVALARRVAMIAFRTEQALERRFGRAAADADPSTFAVRAWLDHHGAALAARFDAATYRTLLDAMDTHDVGRGRGGRAEALRALGAAAEQVTAVGVPGDLLYSDDVVAAWAQVAAATYRAVRSPHGHDAFLLEPAQVGAILREALGRPARPRTAADGVPASLGDRRRRARRARA